MEQAQQGISMAEAFSPASKDAGVLLPTAPLATLMAAVLNIQPHSPQCDWTPISHSGQPFLHRASS